LRRESDGRVANREDVAAQLGVDDDQESGGAADFVDGALAFLAEVVD
tara:strand:- start:134 stop:274 length:141 start_codon:yes stop_codon:yes gene_type:complete